MMWHIIYEDPSYGVKMVKPVTTEELMMEIEPLQWYIPVLQGLVYAIAFILALAYATESFTYAFEVLKGER